LQAVEKTHEVRDLYEPLPPHQRQKTVGNINVALPPDYLELMGQAEGLEVGNIGILGLSQVYEVVMPDWTYYLLAEVNNVRTGLSIFLSMTDSLHGGTLGIVCQRQFGCFFSNNFYPGSACSIDGR
jgi:hypothetical protein